MKLTIITLVSFWLLNTTTIYHLQFQDIDGNTVSMSQFEGKRILLVNIATGSTQVGQLAGLQQLHEQYGDSLVIIGFPTNSFGKESRSNAEIKSFCQANYGVTFLLASKNPIAGLETQSIYQWLTDVEMNGMTGDPVKGNFQKYLVNKSGNLIGVFSQSVNPLSEELTGPLTY
ncbi:MAG TPA: glutathione peroxidase [Chitinophagaceae bacterium]|jgi:glutathione peroxidase|nr:glutathione peroxidase [Chitinophagaceae bacterium]